MRLDLDILHAGFLNPGLPGKTTRMLVAAVQQADFDAEIVAVYGVDDRDIERLMSLFCEIALALGFMPKVVNPWTIRLHSTEYQFRSRELVWEGIVIHTPYLPPITQSEPPNFDIVIHDLDWLEQMSPQPNKKP